MGLERDIADAREAFASAVELRDARAAAAVHATDAIGSSLDGVELETVELERRDGLADGIGRSTLRVGAADGGELVDRGAYVLVHERQQDGTWLRTVETFNPDRKP